MKAKEHRSNLLRIALESIAGAQRDQANYMILTKKRAESLTSTTASIGKCIERKFDFIQNEDIVFLLR